MTPARPSAGSMPSTRPTRRPAMWAIAVVLALVFAGSTLPTPLYVVYQQRLGLSAIVLVLIYAAYVIGTMGALFFFGRLSDQIGRRPTLLPALVFAAASTLVFLFAANLPGLFVARILTGLAVGLCAGTATAWIAELDPIEDRAHSALVGAGANIAGLGIGPLLPGMLAQYAPSPLILSYVVYLVAVVVLAVGTWLTPETAQPPVHRPAEVSVRPRVGVPAEHRATVVAPAANAFVTFALIGFYAALIPTLLGRALHQTSHAVAGAIVAELFFLATIAMVVTRRLDSDRAMLAGLVLLIPSVGLPSQPPSCTRCRCCWPTRRWPRSRSP